MKILLSSLTIRSIKITFLLMIFCNVYSCSNQDELTHRVSSQIKSKNLKFNDNTEICIILPEVGCGGCIASGVSFIDKNNLLKVNKDRVFIVFTAVQSKKILLRNFDVDFLEELNYIIDDNNDYLLNDENSIYPLVLFLDNGKIIKAKYQSPNSSDVFYEVEQFLQDKE